MDKREGSLLEGIPASLPQEWIQVLASSPQVRIERIVSRGHASPPDFWYDQAQSEWVMVVEGEAILQFEDRELHMGAGSYVHIAAHERHRVKWTCEDRPTVWLAVFY